MASVFEATIVQRHPAGTVRVVGTSGVLRWKGVGWHYEPPVTSWLNALTANSAEGDPAVLKAMLAFAVHDLGLSGSVRCSSIGPTPSRVLLSRSGSRYPPPYGSARRRTWLPCDMPWPRSTGQPSSTAKACSVSSE